MHQLRNVFVVLALLGVLLISACASGPRGYYGPPRYHGYDRHHDRHHRDNDRDRHWH